MLCRTTQVLIGLSASSALVCAMPSTAVAETAVAETAVANTAVARTPMQCVVGQEQQTCSVLWQDDVLEIQLKDGRQLRARRLGRWSTTTQDGVPIQQCNMRINLGNDVVYGLLSRSSVTGTTLTWPLLQIALPELKP